MIGAAYMAKWLYPDLMTDLDPDAIFTQWMKYQALNQTHLIIITYLHRVNDHEGG